MTAIPSPIGSVGTRVTRRIDRLTDRQFAMLGFLPGALLVTLIVLAPIVGVLALSLFRVELLRDDRTPFVALANYLTRLPNDAAFVASIPRTVILGLGTAVLTVPLALATALVLNRRFRGSTIVGVAVLLPWAVAPIVTGLYWKFMFNSQFGLMTQLANLAGLAQGPVLWLNDSNTAMSIAAMATAWRTVPLMALLLLAALKAIPSSLYAASRMDGANAWQTFRYVVLPHIRTTLLVVAVLSIIQGMQLLDILFSLTNGGPGDETTTIVYYIYQTAITNLSLGYSAALAVFLLVLIAACSSLLLLPRIRRRSAGDETIERDDLTAADRSQNLGRRLAATRSRASNLGGAAVSSTARSASTVAATTTLSGSFDGPEPRRRRFAVPHWASRVAFVVAVVALLVWLIGPIVWIVLTSVEPEGAVTQLPLNLTLDLRLDHYATLLGDPQWQGSFVVSLLVTVLTTLITIPIAALAAYPLARLEVPGRGLVMGVIVVTQMVPSIVLVIPIFLMFRYVGLEDTVAALVIVNLAFWLPLITWLLRNVFQQVPRSLDAAARIDGAGRLGTLFRVIIPAARPGISAIVILMLIGTWNEFLFAVILGQRNAVTVTRLIGFIDTVAGPFGQPPFTVEAAAGIAAFLPCLVLVVLFYRRLVGGLSSGFIKA